MIKISIIIPVYNGEKFIKSNYDSLIKQGYDNLEIIYVNDGSKDKSLDILKNIQKKDDRVIIINQNNKGVSEARNQGLKKSTGEYIQFLDVDDYLNENCLKEICLFLENKKPDIYRYKMLQKFKKISFSEDMKIPTNTLINLENNNIIYDYVFSTDNLCSSCSGMLKGDIARNHKFNENYIFGEDYLYMISCILDSKTIYAVDKSYYTYVMNDDSVTHIFNVKKVIDILESAISVNRTIETLIHDKNNINVSRKSKSERNICIYINKAVLNLNYKNYCSFVDIIKNNKIIGVEIEQIELYNKKIYGKLLRKDFIMYTLIKGKNVVKNIIKNILN